jgi:hypothetical protein
MELRRKSPPAHAAQKFRLGRAVSGLVERGGGDDRTALRQPASKSHQPMTVIAGSFRPEIVR